MVLPKRFLLQKGVSRRRMNRSGVSKSKSEKYAATESIKRKDGIFIDRMWSRELERSRIRISDEFIVDQRGEKSILPKNSKQPP